MKNISFLLPIFLFLPTSNLLSQETISSEQAPITSRVDSSESGDLFLIQEVLINAPVEAVWKAYTTSNGWKNWASPHAEIDLRINGSILTNYHRNGSIGDTNTNKLTIINYVPYKVLTLQADISKNWPEFMKEDAEKFYNVNLFEATSDSSSKLVSYGIGYQNNQQYLDMMKFFISGNEWSYQKLIAYLEKGQVTKW